MMTCQGAYGPFERIATGHSGINVELAGRVLAHTMDPPPSFRAVVKGRCLAPVSAVSRYLSGGSWLQEEMF